MTPLSSAPQSLRGVNSPSAHSPPPPAAREASDAHAPRRIRELPPDLIDQIAAGEVVERPASVVKELVENALDAGARRIVLDLEDGGRGLVRVEDDGCGIDRDDLLLAVKSHATSKLATREDLMAIATLGFRGEALASIASVSHLTLGTRARSSRHHHHDEHGAEIRVEGGRVAAGPRPAAHPFGTTVEVRNLFFNLPARREFLRGERAELKACVGEAERLALARWDFDLEVRHAARAVLRARPTDEPRERIADVLGNDLAHGLVAVGPVTGPAGYALRGYASPLDRSRGDAREQLFFLNGRAVRDRVFLGAVREAYANLLPPRRHPSVVLWLDAPAGEVDVNVHPTKAEVRFRRSHEVYSLVVGALREAIARSGAPPPALRWPGGGGGNGDGTGIGNGVGLGDGNGNGVGVGNGGASEAPAWILPGVARRSMQIGQRYIIEETESGFRVVDPHALHERLLYDEIVARLAEGKLEAQRFLFPLVIAATPAEREGLADAERRAALERLGFEVEPFGPDSVAVHAAPRLAPAARVVEIVRDLMRDQPPSSSCGGDAGEGETRARSAADELLHAIAAQLACKSAVRFGDALAEGEAEALLAKRDGARATCCPHGRPTALAISFDELDRRFARC